jgi:hypothetical protein
MAKTNIRKILYSELSSQSWSAGVVSFWKASLISFAMTVVLMGIGYAVIAEWFPKIYVRKDELIIIFTMLSPLSVAFLSGGFWRRYNQSVEQISIHGISLGLVEYLIYFFCTAPPILGDYDSDPIADRLIDIGVPESSLFIIVPAAILLLTLGLVYAGYFAAGFKKKSPSGMPE